MEEQRSSIVLTTHTELSLLYRVLRTVIRPFRPRLVSPGKPLPAGSPRLKPPKVKCLVQEREVEGIFLYDFQDHTHKYDKHLRKTPQHQIYYFAGGGFQSPPSKEHWKLCAEMGPKLRDLYDVTLVSYPLAPNSPGPESLPMLRKWLRVAVQEARQSGKSVTLMGDSAGGNVILSLAFWAASEFVPTGHISTLKSVFVISPATDLRNQNPGIMEADKHDPVLTVGLTTEVGRKWAGEWSTDRPELSPNLADFSALQVSGIKVHGVVGTHDVLAPDAIVFRELCEKHQIPGEWLQWDGQMHCFPLAFAYGLSEGTRGKDWILDVLRRNV